MSKRLPWFRMYVDFLNDPKILRLAFEDQRHFIGLLALKSDGALDEIDDDPVLLDRIVAQRLWIDHAVIREVKKRLIAVGLIDECWQPVAWSKRQYASDTDPTAADRKRRQRERDKGVTDESRVTVTNVTRTDSDTDAYSEPEEQKACSPSACTSDDQSQSPPTEPVDQPVPPPAPAPAPPTAPPPSPPTGGGKKEEKPLKVDDLVAEGVDRQHASDWLTARRAKKAPLTPTAWAVVKSQAAKAGITPAQAVQCCAEKSWQGFNASWYAKLQQEESRAGGRDAHGKPVSVTSQQRSFAGVEYGPGRVHPDFKDIEEGLRCD